MNIEINLSGEQPAWPDLADKQIEQPSPDWKVSIIPNGMSSGRTAVAIRMHAPDGVTIVAEQSLAQMVMLGAALKGYADRVGEL